MRKASLSSTMNRRKARAKRKKGGVCHTHHLKRLPNACRGSCAASRKICVATFCQQSLFFRSKQAASTFLADHPEALLLSVEEAASVGRLVAQSCAIDAT